MQRLFDNYHGEKYILFLEGDHNAFRTESVQLKVLSKLYEFLKRKYPITNNNNNNNNNQNNSNQNNNFNEQYFKKQRNSFKDIVT